MVRKFLSPATDFVPALAILLFLGAMFWAKRQDPFFRKWGSIFADGHAFKYVAVFPKPVQRRPVVIYAHGSGGSLVTDGNDLRQMAELGLAVVSLEYDQTNEVAFTAQFEALLRFVGEQKWADTNAMAWVGVSLGSIRMFDFTLQHPDQQPKLLVLLSGKGLEPSLAVYPRSSVPKCPVLLVHGEEDEVFPVKDAERLRSALQSSGNAVRSEVIPGLPHDLEPYRKAVLRLVGEYCRGHLQKTSAGWWEEYHCVAQWQAEAPSLVWFWLPAAAWIGGWRMWKRRLRPVPLEGPKLSRYEIALRWVAAILAAWALVETSLHLLPPHFPVSGKTLALARKFSVQDKERADFEVLAGWPIWKGEKLSTLLDHMELAVYNRELINWQLDQTNYEKYVLNPVITGKPGEQLNWRRPLWEEFYPRIRHENSPTDAAQIVVRHLRERVTVVAGPNLPHDVPNIWLRQLTDERGFEIIYIAALRSVGVPARLNATGVAEIFADTKWQTTPAPAIMSW
jgi:acetyl esterase/lipase